jgi:hypothetical protein
MFLQDELVVTLRSIRIVLYMGKVVNLAHEPLAPTLARFVDA